jgi:hypothetical protein
VWFSVIQCDVEVTRCSLFNGFPRFTLSLASSCFHFFPSVPRCSVSASHPLRQLFIGALPRMPSLDTLTDSTRAYSVEHPAIYQRLYSILQPNPEYFWTMFSEYPFASICPSLFSAWCLVFVIVWPVSGQCRLLDQGDQGKTGQSLEICLLFVATNIFLRTSRIQYDLPICDLKVWSSMNQ